MRMSDGTSPENCWAGSLGEARGLGCSSEQEGTSTAPLNCQPSCLLILPSFQLSQLATMIRPLLFEIGFGLASEIRERLNNPLEGRYRTINK